MEVLAGLHADIQTLATLFQLGMPLSDIVVKAAALSGRLSILQHLLREQQCPAPLKVSYHAARSGSIDMLDWLKAQSWCEFNDFACAGAARGGHLAVLQHLRSQGCDWDNNYIAGCAASSGSIPTVEWLRQQPGIELNADVMGAAVCAGHNAMCEHLRSVGCDWDVDTCSYAVACGHLDTLRWLREHGCPWDVCDVCLNATCYGFPDVLDYVLEQGEVLDAELLTTALNGAGAHGQLPAAQWLRQHGAHWPAVLWYRTGHGPFGPLKVWSGAALAWARAEGCTSRSLLLLV